jgi:ADP-heptose:LPS heptosyltransferase
MKPRVDVKESITTLFDSVKFRHNLRPHRGKPLILVERYAGLGDIVCTFPLLEALRTKYPGAFIVYHTTKALKEFPMLSGYVDAVISMERSDKLPSWIRVREVHRPQYDLIFLPGNDVKGKKLHESADVHLVDLFCQPYNLTPASRQPRIRIEPERRNRIEDEIVRAGLKRKPLIVIHCGPTWAVRSWPVSHWNRLVELLQEEMGATVIQLGADWHFDARGERGDRVARAVDWVGRFSLPDSAAVIAAADLFIGLDSGLLHVAGGVGCPSIAIFGPTEPLSRLPPETPSVAVRADLPCTGCHHLSKPLHWQSGCPNEIACMKSVPAQAVFSMAQRLLSGGSPPFVDKVFSV